VHRHKSLRVKCSLLTDANQNWKATTNFDKTPQYQTSIKSVQNFARSYTRKGGRTGAKKIREELSLRTRQKQWLNQDIRTTSDNQMSGSKCVTILTIKQRSTLPSLHYFHRLLRN